MSTVRIDLDIKKLEQVQAQMPQFVGRELRKLAFEGEAFIKMSFGTSPSAAGMPPGVDTGKLRNSIRAEKLGTFGWQIATDTEYGPHLEYGTSKMAARPFMGPGLDFVARIAGERFAGFLEKSL